MFLDSKLVVEQISGRYRIKDPILSLHHQTIVRLLKVVGHVTVTYIPRAQNSQADHLVNQILDLHQ
jgi:ribonuclease HI